MCGMIASCNHFGREPYPLAEGRVRTWTCPRREPARSRMPANHIRTEEARTAARLRRSGDNALEWRRDVRPPSDSKKSETKKPAAGFPARVVKILAMMKLC